MKLNKLIIIIIFIIFCGCGRKISINSDIELKFVNEYTTNTLLLFRNKYGEEIIAKISQEIIVVPVVYADQQRNEDIKYGKSFHLKFNNHDWQKTFIYTELLDYMYLSKDTYLKFKSNDVMNSYICWKSNNRSMWKSWYWDGKYTPNNLYIKYVRQQKVNIFNKKIICYKYRISTDANNYYIHETWSPEYGLVSFKLNDMPEYLLVGIYKE